MSDDEENNTGEEEIDLRDIDIEAL